LIDFERYFAAEIAGLREYQDLGLVTLDGDWIAVTPRGRLMVRVVAMLFDRYLRTSEQRARYSKVI
jgi:oxygen-independent coproporphyrinogen-3 oxidase